MNQSKPSRWVIGSRPDCDIIVDQPTVSGRHCQIQFEDGQWQVKDLDSTNGTWVDGVRIEAVRDIDRGTPIRLGQTVYLDWQQVPSTEPEITIGRSKENDVTLEHASVSGRHARLRCTPDGLVLEDLGSTNGTFVGTPHWNDRIEKQPVSLSDRVRFGDEEASVDKLVRQVAADRADVAIWLAKNPQTAPPTWVPGKRILIAAALVLFAVVGFGVIQNYTGSKTEDPTPQSIAKTTDTIPTEQPQPADQQPEVKPQTQPNVASAEQKSEPVPPPPKDSESQTAAKMIGSDDGIYSVVVRTLSDGLGFQVGTAWALDDQWMVTSAEVVHAAEQSEENAELEVYWGGGDTLAIERVVVHPEYEAAEKAADAAFNAYKALLEKQSEQATAQPEAEFESQVAALNKTFRESVSMMAYFDLALLKVKLPKNEQIRHPLQLGKTPINRIKGRDLKMLGHPHEMLDDVEFDPDNIELSQVNGEILTSTQWNADGESSDGPGVYLVHVECPASEISQLRSYNWMGSPVMDKQGNVVGVFSRLVVPEGSAESGDQKSKDNQASGTERERRIFLMAILDRLSEFPALQTRSGEAGQ